MSSHDTSRSSGVVGETLILTDTGYYHISVMDGKIFKVWNGRQFVEVDARMIRKSCPVITVFTDDGQKIVCAPDHKFMIDVEASREISSIPDFDKTLRVAAVDLQPHMKLAISPFPVIFSDGEDLDFEHAYLRGVASVYGRQDGIQTILEFVPENRIMPCKLPFQCEGNIFGVPRSYSIKTRLQWIAGFFDASLNPGIMGSKMERFKAGISRHSNPVFLNEVQTMLQTLGVRSSIVPLDNEPGNFGLMVHIYYIFKLFELGMECYCIKSPKENFSIGGGQKEPSVFVKYIINNFEISTTYIIDGCSSAVYNGILTG